MQLSLLKTLFILGTLAGVTLADGGYGYGKKYNHHKGGVIKRTILIDGCTGKPVEKAYHKNGGGGGGGIVIEDDGVEDDGVEEPEQQPPPPPPELRPMFDDLYEDGPPFYEPRGYPAIDELVDDYNYLGGGDITGNELII